MMKGLMKTLAVIKGMLVVIHVSVWAPTMEPYNDHIIITRVAGEKFRSDGW